MKALFFIAFVALLSACDGKKISGDVKIAENENVTLTDDSGRDIKLRDGDAQIVLQSRSVFDSKLELQTDYGKWIFKIPKEAYSQATSFRVSAAAINQPVGLVGEPVTEIIDTQIVEGERSCTSPGFCCKAGLTLSGSFETSCSYWRNCPGKRRAEFKVTRLSERFLVKFLNDSDQTVGSFKSKAQTREQREVIRNLSDCN